MGQIRSFRDLIAWQRGMKLARLVYIETRRLPREERFGLTSQMRRAAVSAPANIAEGYGRERLADYLKHLRIARGSLFELGTHLDLAREVGLLTPSEELLSILGETERVLQGLIQSLQQNETSSQSS